jgi:deferrochelatase/peroxidase EfeB
MRRANPRDGLAPNPADANVFRNASNHHRILRRGRKYGPVFDGLAWAERVAQNPGAEPKVEASDDERGLLFMAINTDITRQFEFVQQTWVLNKSFAALSGETDPLVGPKGPFTVPGEPLRALPEVDTFVRLVGGDYFFLPSLAALSYLAQLK